MRDRHRRLAVQPRFAVHVLRAELDARDVAHAQDRTVGIGADDDIAECCRRDQAPLGLQVELELLVVADRPRADAADRRLHVLRLDGGDDVVRRQVQADQPVGVEPDPHRIVQLGKQAPGRRPACATIRPAH